MGLSVSAAFTLNEMARDVRAGLAKPGQKELPSKYLYDDVGSALFEVICLLPEYGLTRAGYRLLRRNADAIVQLLPQRVTVAELGSGSARKTRLLLEALSRRRPTTYHPIEISPHALALCRRELMDIDSVSVVGFEKEYLEGLHEAAARRAPAEHLLVLFLGSTIGNFDRPAGLEFLRRVRRILRAEDAMLLATDLMKPVPVLLEAYDDPLGVTAAFNLNLLARLNRELDADFQLENFAHVARWDAAERRIEMHLRSKRDQTASIPKADLTMTLRKDETIWTESSHKYTVEEVVRMAEETGYRCEAQWVDREWPFAHSLLFAQ